MKLNFSTSEKKFCCLKMKDEIQTQIYEEIKDMTAEERLAYFKKPTDQPLFNHLREKNMITNIKNENSNMI